MRIVMYAIGAFGAGLFFLFKDGLPYLNAARSGRVRTRGHRATVVDRAVEPERFRKLMAGRRAGVLLALALLAGGIAGLGFGAVLFFADAY